jgi:hypothetical protein
MNRVNRDGSKRDLALCRATARNHEYIVRPALACASAGNGAISS